jgi:photosystem II stability/assembly factor-like uncharacterized protein
MTPKFNRILILFFIFTILTLSNQSVSAEQTASPEVYLPLISNDPSSWIGPYGGTIVAIATDPTNPQISYAGTFGAGVFKSTDGGHTWNSSSTGLSNLYVYSLAIDPQHPSTIYAGTYRNQIFKSSDGGLSWSWSGTGMQDQAIVYSIAIDPYDPTRIYAATRGISNNGSQPWNGVVYRSTNAGQTWEINIENLGGTELQDWAYQITVNPNHHEMVYAAFHETGAWLSSDYGDHWAPILTGITDWSGRSIVASPIPANSWTLFFGVWHFDTVYKTDNNGYYWVPVNEGILNKRVYSVVLDPQDINTVYLATIDSGIIKSTSGGKSWQNGGLPNDQIYSLVINPANNSRLLVGTAGDGLFRTDDKGITWLRSDTGIENALITSVVISPSDPDTLYSSVYGGGVYLSTNRGSSWQNITTSLTTSLPDLYVLGMVMDPAHPQYLYAMTSASGLYRCDLNSGNSWSRVGTGLPLTQNNLPAYPPDHPFATLDMQESFAYPPETTITSPLSYTTLRNMVFAPSNPQIAYMATAGAGVYKSTDGTQSWQPAGLTSQNILALAVDPANPLLVYAAIDTPGSLKMSTNGGQNWSDLNLGGVTFYSLATSLLEPNAVYAGTDAGIYRYNSGIFASLGLSDQSITAISTDQNQPGSIFAGTNLGAYHTTDSGLHWTFVNDNLRNKVIQSISIDPNNDKLVYFGTKTSGIFLAAVRQ